MLLVVAASGALMLAPQLIAPRSPPPLLLAKKSGGAAQKTTQVVLTGDVKDVGKKGELVSVKPAYAQNFLVAQGLGRVATPEVLEQLERERQEAFEAALLEVLAKHAVDAIVFPPQATPSSRPPSSSPRRRRRIFIL